MGSHISQKWCEIRTGDREIDGYGWVYRLVIENVDRCDWDYRLVIEIIDRYGWDIEVTSWLVSADDFSSRVARGANEWVQRLLATSEEKSDKRTNHEVICLFYTYWDFKRILRKKIVMKNKFISNRVIKLNDGMTKSFGRKGTPFIYLLLRKGTPFTYLL